jgi:hypothetical protein
MFEQALELRIEVLIVFDAIDVMTLDHPLDMKRRNRDAEWIVLKYLSRNRFRWSNDLAIGAEAFGEVLSKTFEKLNVLGFFACKL